MNKLYIVSTGAGGISYLTTQAIKAIKESSVIVGYSKYLKELNELISDKKVLSSGMSEEIQRCNLAINSALNGEITSIISNGDVNVFAMASLIIELIEERDLWDKLEVISIAGVSAIFATASKVGAPISQDFAVISLSDRLNDIKMIEKRIESALSVDFVIGIYNPLSKTRKKPYEILLTHLKNYDKRVVIIASNVGRNDELIIISDTFELIKDGIDNKNISMSTLIIIGNSNTTITKNNKVLTKRGYLNKYDIDGKMKK